MTVIEVDSSRHAWSDWANREALLVLADCPSVGLTSKVPGAGLRLSWPRLGDGRRAVVGKLSSSASDGEHNARDARFVNVSYRDMEAYYEFAKSQPNGTIQPIFDIPLLWNPAKMDTGTKELLHYFQYAASQSLASLGHDSMHLGNVLLRIALTSDTTSSTALLQSLLALSSLHRHDVHLQAAELKIAALKSLGAVMGSDIGTKEAIQHVAAGMLLCSFEIHQASCIAGQWTWHLCGVKEIIKTSGLDKMDHDGDVAMLLDWVYYHDILARFSLPHWHRETTETTPDPWIIRAKVSHAAPPALALIELLSEVCEAVSAGPPAPLSGKKNNDYKNFLKILDWKIRSLPQAALAGDCADATLMMELYQLAVLVYLNRASNNLLNQATRTRKQIEKAFTIFPQLGSCERQFPVFVLGCEARSDDQRMVVLDLISRTEKREASRSFNHVKLLLQAIWAPADLAEEEMD